ncbi:hypothetical protein CT761_003917 [Escherichia coli]|nr:hypothetical protein [Escherichia coli]
MRIGMRLLLGYFLLVAVAAWFVLAIFVKEVKPGVRRATEGTLIDTATLLAELARPDLLSGDPTHGQLAQAFNQLQHRPFRANIGGINKVRNEYHVYMTDSQGKVLFDSANKAVGQDYSRWNDVWLTLRGQYGARSTLQNPADPESSVMYVAAPIMDGSRLIGVLSVGKPNAAMAPVIKRSERRILWASAILLGIALVIGAGGRITLSAEVDQEHVALKVLDTGSGIPDYALSRIFERFYSLPRANGQKSSGLGLAFVSEVARLFNGEVTLRNVQEGGVLASLRLHRHFT